MVDNSPSMRQEIDEVVRQLNQTLYPILVNAGLDFRVALLSSSGRSVDLGVCVVEPLGNVPDPDGNGQCDPGDPRIVANPANQRFLQVDEPVYSINGLCKFLDALDKGRFTNLRKGSAKHIVMITDDEAKCIWQYEREDGTTKQVEFTTKPPRLPRTGPPVPPSERPLELAAIPFNNTLLDVAGPYFFEKTWVLITRFGASSASATIRANPSARMSMFRAFGATHRRLHPGWRIRNYPASRAGTGTPTAQKNPISARCFS